MNATPACLPFMYVEALAELVHLPVVNINAHIQAGRIQTVEVNGKTFIDLRPFLIIVEVLE